jgi:hypothetical protein
MLSTDTLAPTWAVECPINGVTRVDRLVGDARNDTAFNVIVKGGSEAERLAGGGTALPRAVEYGCSAAPCSPTSRVRTIDPRKWAGRLCGGPPATVCWTGSLAELAGGGS